THHAERLHEFATLDLSHPYALPAHEKARLCDSVYWALRGPRAGQKPLPRVCGTPNHRFGHTRSDGASGHRVIGLGERSCRHRAQRSPRCAVPECRGISHADVTFREPRLELVSDATLVMDTAPGQITDGSGTPSANVRSLFQCDAPGVRLTCDLNWGMRADGAVQWIGAVNW